MAEPPSAPEDEPQASDNIKSDSAARDDIGAGPY
jgi:hypothetical protein